MSWEEMFSPIILERGYDYFHYKHVTSLCGTDDGFTAVVSGTEDYTVDIILDDNDDVIDAECTCPYADDGNWCKHMAAVLYAVEHQNGGVIKHIDSETGNAGKIGGTSVSLEELVAGLDSDIVRKELTIILKSNQNLRAAFILKYAHSEESIANYIERMIQTADEIKYQYSDRHGFVDWRNASGFTGALQYDVVEKLRDFINDDAEEARAAFNVSLYVYDLFATTDIDDDGDAQMLADTCLAFWEDVLAGAEDDDFAKYMLDKLTEECEKLGFSDYMSERIEEFISDHFDGNGLAATKLETIDKRIERLEHEKSWSGTYALSSCVMERLKLMESLGVAQSEIDEFSKKYWHLPDVRKAEMKKLESAGEVKKLIQMLEESKEIDRGLAGLVSEYSKKLIDCYKEIGDTEKMETELFKYVTLYSHGNIQAFTELKALYDTARWETKREEVFAALSGRGVDIKPLLAAEGLKERLYESLIMNFPVPRHTADFRLAEVNKYAAILRPEYDEALLDIYDMLVDLMAEYAGGRSYYQQIVANAKKMLAFPGGKERIKDLIKQWRSRYSNRRAMMEEIQALYLAD